MKRPVIVTAVLFAIAAACGTYFSLPHSGMAVQVMLFSIGLAILIGGTFERLEQLSACAVILLLCCLFVVGYQRTVTKPVQRLSREESLAVRATVLDYADVYEDTQRVALRITGIGEQELGDRAIRPFKTLCYLPLTPAPLEPGDELETRLSFYIPDIRDGFERKEHYASNGYFILASHEDGWAIRCQKRAPIWWSYPLRLAQNLKASVAANLPARESGLLNAILFGDKAGMSDADSRYLRKAGLSHMAAVSGMHVGFLTMFLCAVFSKRYGSLLSILAILFFIPMAGASPSVIRAAVMYILLAGAFFLRKERESLNSLAAALIVLLALNPYSISSISLQLSFGATLGLLLFSRRLQEILCRPFQTFGQIVRRLANTIASAVSCSLCAMVFTTPVLLASFGYVTVLSPLANLLTLPVFGAAFVLGFILALCGVVFPVACAPLAAVEGWLLSYILNVSEWISHLPFGLVYWGNSLGNCAIFAFYGAVLLLLLFRRKRYIYLIVPTLCAALTICSLLAVQEGQHTTKLTVLPSGSGQTLVYTTADSVTVIDCGADGGRNAAKAVLEFLDWNGREVVDTLILTAVDKTHARSAAELLSTGLVEVLILPESGRSKEVLSEIQTAAMLHRVRCYYGIPAALPDGITLSDAVEQKLVAEIAVGGREVLTVHSLTQKMLAAFLENNPRKADILLLSENNLEDALLLRAAFDILEPDEIILASGRASNEKVLRIPCHNTKLEGEIVLAETKGGAAEWQ